MKTHDQKFCMMYNNTTTNILSWYVGVDKDNMVDDKNLFLAFGPGAPEVEILPFYSLCNVIAKDYNYIWLSEIKGP